MMDDAGGTASLGHKMRGKVEDDEDSDEEVLDSEDDEETIARIQRAHFAQAAAMNPRRRSNTRPRPMSHKRKMEAVKSFHDFTKKLKQDTGIRIRSLMGNNLLELSDFSSESKSDSDGLSEEEFVVNPNAVQDLNDENESYIDPETGDFVEGKKKEVPNLPQRMPEEPAPQTEQPKTLSISDIINEGDLDLSKNVEIAEVEGSELCSEKTAEELLGIKEEETSQDFDITEKLKVMDEISVKPVNKNDSETENVASKEENKADNDEEKKVVNPNALNVRRNIREVMDEKNLDASTLAAQRQESERLARVQEQQRIIREVQRQIAINRQNKIHQKTLSLLQGGSSLLKKSGPGQKLNLPNTVLVKLPSGEKKTTLKHGQVELTKVSKPTASGSMLSQKPKSDKKEVVEIVDSSSGEESSSSSSDSDDCIMLSDSEVPPSPEAEEDPGNSGLHVNDAYNIPDEQGRVLINIGHAENEEDIFLAPQIARIIKPHQIGGVRFLFDNIIESVERFSTSTGFGCILAHSMGLGKTLQIVCFCDIFLRHTSSKTVLCIMPINTLQNWVAEFNMWLPLDATNSPLGAHGEVRPRNFPIYVLNDSHKTLQMRAKVVKDWTSTGGVLMIGYELYRLLSMKKDKKPRKKRKADAKLEAEKEKEKEEKKNDVANDDTQNSDITQSKNMDDKDNGNKLDNDKDKEEKKDDVPNDEDKKLLDEMYEALVRPGPDLVICDEGHRIKNSHSNISYALKQMRTKRRVVLTGYPLQNNLLEYWCMVDFVRPNYLGSKTEFCNMFERPIQNGQCIDSTPQDIRLMRYRAHVLHSLLVGFVQRRSHAVLQSTLPQKEEYVLLVRMTPLQRKLYDRFMNEVVRSTSVPNPLKAFAICCKIWNHPDVLYNFLRKRSEASAMIEEDLDLEEIGGVTKSGRPRTSKTPGRKPGKPRGAPKKPAATIQPNTTAGSKNSGPDPSGFNSTNYTPNGPPSYGPPSTTTPYPDRPEGYTSYPGYQNSGPGFYPPSQGFDQEYNSNYYQQQQPPYSNNYPNQFPQNNPECNSGYNQNYWPNSNYYGNSGYYNNPQYPNNQQPPSEFRANPPPDYNNSQQYPPNYNNPTATDQAYPGNAIQPFTNNQDMYGNQHRSGYEGNFNNTTGYSNYTNTPNQTTGASYPNNQSVQEYPQTSYPPPSYTGNNPNYGANSSVPYNQYQNQNPNYEFSNNMAPNDNSVPNPPVKSETNMDTSFGTNESKPETNINQNQPVAPYSNQPYNYQQQSTPNYPESEVGTNGNYQFPNFPSTLETKPPLGSASSGSPITSWPMPETLKTELDKIKSEDKMEMKSESDGEVKIEDLDTKKIVKDDFKKELKPLQNIPIAPQKELNVNNMVNKTSKPESKKSENGEESESEQDGTKKGKRKGKAKDNKKADKPKPRGRGKAKGRKDRKGSKEKNNEESESEESEKEEKLNKEEEMALVKKAEEMTYDWAAELLKDYIPGIIENSAKMELFFYILNESIKLGDRLLLFSQSLFTLNLIEDFLVRNYIPGTNRLWERNSTYYRLDGSTHALEREKLINEFNANPNVYLFLVSTRAGSLGINLVGANRVIVFDASWNPCHDTQAVCRVYRYGQRKPCFVYRFVMDCCLEKKIYDRQINKQGMADRVVDECNPDAVLSMKEITNLCFDNDEKELEPKDLSEHIDKYLDVLMQGVISLHSKLLSKEPFQHESLLVDRKEKKLSSAEKRLAQRGYELEKKAALAPKPTPAYRTVRAADGSLVQRPVASVRPMQHAARWIPADVWRRQGMTAQEMTLPLDVVIPTNSAEKTNIVLKAGQRVMVLKSPKGIYMQLESGKIIAIKTSFKGLQKGTDKESPVGKKVLGTRPTPSNIPGSLKNNSAITITSKSGQRPGYQRVLNRSMGQKIARPMLPGQKIAEIRNRLGDMRYANMRAKFASQNPRLLRPNLPGSVSITKIQRKPDSECNESMNKSDEETQVLDSDDEDNASRANSDSSSNTKTEMTQITNNGNPQIPKNDHGNNTDPQTETTTPKEPEKPIVLTTDEKLPSEEALENKFEEKQQQMPTPNKLNRAPMNLADKTERKINLLKNYRHQRPSNRPQAESSLSQLEKTASALNKEGIPDFRKNLDDITQSYSPGTEERTGSKSRKKKSPNKVDTSDMMNDRPTSSSMSHSVSSLLGPGNVSSQKPKVNESIQNVSPMHTAPRPSNQTSIPGLSQEPVGHPHGYNLAQNVPPNKPTAMGHGGMIGSGSSSSMDSAKISTTNNIPQAHSGFAPGALPPPGQTYAGNNTAPDGAYSQYPGYGMNYAAYPNAAYYGGYGGSYYPPYGAPPAPFAPPAPTPAAAPAAASATASAPAPAPPEHYLPPNPQW